MTLNVTSQAKSFMQVYCFKGMSTFFFLFFNPSAPTTATAPPHKEKKKERELNDRDNSVVEGAERRRH